MPTRPLPVAMPAPVIPQRKISETIIDFGAPLILDLHPDEHIENVRATFNVVITVWDAHVMAMPVWGRPELLDQLKALLRTPGAAPELVDAYTKLSARRLTYFRDDPRSVGEWSVQFDQAGRIRLHCDAHVPPSLLHGRM